jgi:hypothetical protein
MHQIERLVAADASRSSGREEVSGQFPDGLVEVDPVGQPGTPAHPLRGGDAVLADVLLDVGCGEVFHADRRVG